MYYLRSQAATQAFQFTVEKQAPEQVDAVIPKVAAVLEASRCDSDDAIVQSQLDRTSCDMEGSCVSCGS